MILEKNTMCQAMQNDKDFFQQVVWHANDVIHQQVVSEYGNESWSMLHVGQEILTLFGTPDFTPNGQFMISPIHCVYLLPNLSVLWLGLILS